MQVVAAVRFHTPSLYTSKGILKFSCTVKGGQCLWYRNGKAVITDCNYRVLGEAGAVNLGIVENGQHPFSFGCEFSGEEGPEVTVRVFTKGEPTEICLDC